ncbi:CubicO group peptidase (beta-lactamase class C family) [Kineothrix alysoides]|uniref:CubicO group peptidase (Beta-lactamase class C family) n=1 Tax=Kineothrix alysoides TaxID=1469948 RepID=A0A4R1R131_9FIRM|nr:serine hydrolase domain-containing protein [Kineothrix alysoides]TCL58988.1 CubicO group peptidase (beta-lactamase class C family) [Kineothrix alysoides]
MKKLYLQAFISLFSLLVGFTMLPIPSSAKNSKNNNSTSEHQPSEALLTAENKIYGIGSISKTVTTTAILKLADQGLIKLDSPVSEYLPQFTMPDERYKKITIRMLLNHSSGLLGSLYSNSDLYGCIDDSNHDRILKHLSTQRLKASPGEYSVYSNDSFELAELIIEEVSGLSYTDYITKYIMAPLGANDTITMHSDFENSDIAATYKNNRLMPTVMTTTLGDGGILSTAADLCTFSTMFMKDHHSVLSSASVAESIRKQVAGPLIYDGNYGLGWDEVNAYPFSTYHIQAVTKGGDTDNYHAMLTVLPDYNMSAAVVSSEGSSTYASLLSNELLLSALNSTIGLQEVTPETAFSGEPAAVPDEYFEFTGLYNGVTSFTLDFKNNKIYLTLYSAPASSNNKINKSFELTYLDSGYFICKDDNILNTIMPASQRYITEGFRLIKSGNTYAVQAEYYAKYFGVSTDFSSLTLATKLDDFQASSQAKTAWKNRNNKKYFLLDEHYASASYISKPYIEGEVLNHNENYFVINGSLYAITGNDSLSNVGKKRDIVDINITPKDNLEYLSSTSGFQYVGEEYLSNLNLDQTYTIQTDGFTQWYRITESIAGTYTSIEISGEGSYFIYNQYGALIDSSLFMNGTMTSYLIEDGYIAFAGKQGTEFKIK